VCFYSAYSARNSLEAFKPDSRGAAENTEKIVKTINLNILCSPEKSRFNQEVPVHFLFKLFSVLLCELCERQVSDLNHLNGIARPDRSAGYHFRKDSLFRHHAITGLVENSAAGMAFLADLGNLQQGLPYLEPCSDRQ